jgi:hypothetical protein
MESMRLKEDQNTWNVMFSVFFFFVLVGALYVMRAVRGVFPTSLPVFDAVLMVLAAFRMTRLVVYDKITRFFREWFLDKRTVVVNGVEHVELRLVTHGVRRTLYDLVDCPWCIGMWSALIIAFCYFIFPWAWFVILFLAVAGASSFIQVSANAVGWDAEHRKLEVREKIQGR